MLHTRHAPSPLMGLTTARIAADCRKWTTVFHYVSSNENTWSQFLDADPLQFASHILPSCDERGIGQAVLLLTLALMPNYTNARRRWIDDVFALILNDGGGRENKYDILIIACCWKRVPFSYLPFADSRRRASYFELCTSAARLVRYYCSEMFDPDILPLDIPVGAWTRCVFSRMDAPRAHILEAMVPMLRTLYTAPENVHAQEIFKFLIRASVLGVVSTLAVLERLFSHDRGGFCAVVRSLSETRCRALLRHFDHVPMCEYSAHLAIECPHLETREVHWPLVRWIVGRQRRGLLDDDSVDTVRRRMGRTTETCAEFLNWIASQVAHIRRQLDDATCRMDVHAISKLRVMSTDDILCAMKRLERHIELAHGQVPPHLVCPLTLHVFVSPMIASDGHTYEEFAIRRWLATKATSPMCGTKLTSTRLYENRAVAWVIDALFD